MNHHPRRILTPGTSRKRKEREAPLYSAKPSAPPSTAGTITTSSNEAEPVSSRRLLAGYMAYEFLTKGTLFGQKWDPARAEAMPLSSGLGESKRTKPSQSQSTEAEPIGRVKPQHQHSYAEVSSLLTGDGAHVPGIVNPTQLARWIQM